MGGWQMNDLVDFRKLGMATKSFCEQIPWLKDEPTYNYVTRVMLLSALTDRREVVEEIFGSRNICIENPLHAGFGALALNKNLLNGKYDETPINEHSMLPLFKPFIKAENYSHAVKLALGSLGNGMNLVVGLRKDEMFRTHPAVCVDCVSSDKQLPHNSSYRRSQQILAVSHCAIHQTPLIQGCSICGSFFEYFDLPSLDCPKCGEKLTLNAKDMEVIPDISAQIRISKVIAAIFSGEIPVVDTKVRLAVLQKQVKEVIKNRSGVIGDNLATHLNIMFGRSFLEKIGLPTHRAPSLGWPALLIYGRVLVEDPIANVLLIAALFESVAHYNDSINKQIASGLNMENLPKPLRATGKIGVNILKDILCYNSLNEVIKKNCQKNYSLIKWAAAYPGLSERRNVFQFKRQLKNCKRSIQLKLENEPELSRTKAHISLGFELYFVKKHDPQWLDQNLPSLRKNNNSKFTEKVKSVGDKDEELFENLTIAVNQEKSGRGRPKQLSKFKVLSMSGLRTIPAEERESFPKTSTLINQASESMEDFYRRSLVWAASNLVSQYGECNNITELFIHANIGLSYVRLLEDFAQTLLE
jgi:hypothetical protein